MTFEDYIEHKRFLGIKKITIDILIKNDKWIRKSARQLGYSDDMMKWSAADFAKIIRYMGNTPNTRSYLKIYAEDYMRFEGHPVDIPILENRETVNAKWISTEDMMKCLNNATDPRYKMIIHLGGNYGLRRGEMSRLRVEDIGHDFMIVHGKGHGEDGKIRKVMLMDNDILLESYLEWREKQIQSLTFTQTTEQYEDKPTGIPTEWKHGPLLFLLNVSKKQFKRMSPEMISLRSRELFKKNNVDASTHSLRREFVTSAYHSGADIATIAQIVGHEDTKVTLKYIEKDAERQKNVLNQRNQYISNISIHT